MKNNNKKIIIFFFVILGIFFWARSNYMWSKLVIKEESKTGWVVVETQADYINITLPWTIFKQPVTRIAFVKPNEFVKMNNGLVLVKTLWVDYSDMSTTKEEIFQSVYDCQNNRTAFVEDNLTANQVSISQLEWRNNIYTSDITIAKLACK